MLTLIISTRSRSLSARLQPETEHTRLRLTTPFGGLATGTCTGAMSDPVKLMPVKKVLRTLSRGLVEIKQAYPGGGDSGNKETARQRIQDRRRVQFIHESVRDFLLHHDGLRLIDPDLGQSAVGKSHDQLTKACVSYLNIEELQINHFLNIYDDNATAVIFQFAASAHRTLRPSIPLR
jgi:hypothetical protein